MLLLMVVIVVVVVVPPCRYRTSVEVWRIVGGRSEIKAKARGRGRRVQCIVSRTVVGTKHVSLLFTERASYLTHIPLHMLDRRRDVRGTYPVVLQWCYNIVSQ
jgi:hypothetical protein